MEDAGQATDMVEVVVREHDEGHLRDRQVMQAAVYRNRIRASVDNDGCVRSNGQHQTIALSDIAGNEDPPTRRPS